MITRIAAIGSLAALLAAASTSTATADDTFKARLSGDQEVPAVTDQGTTGKFEIQFNRDFTEGDYTLRVDSGVRVTQAHLHCAPAGVNGPVIIFLAGFQERGWDVDGKWVSNATVTNANIINTACGATLAQIAHAAASGRVYANIHSVAKPGGVARGQLEGP
jgi:hypothetical protein